MVSRWSLCRRMITAELEFTVELRLVRLAVSPPDRVKHLDGDRAAAGSSDRHPDRLGSVMDGDRLGQTIQTLGLDLGRFHDTAFGKTIQVGPDRRGCSTGPSLALPRQCCRLTVLSLIDPAGRLPLSKAMLSSR